MVHHADQLRCLRGDGMEGASAPSASGETRFPEALVFGHILLAAAGLVVWTVYLVADRDGLAWTSLGILVAVALPGRPGSTGEQRVQATRDRRAADRTVTARARANAATLRQLVGQITALTTSPPLPGPHSASSPSPSLKTTRLPSSPLWRARTSTRIRPPRPAVRWGFGRQASPGGHLLPQSDAAPAVSCWRSRL